MRILFFLFLFFPLSVFAAPTCGTDSIDGISYNYCYQKGQAQNTVLYFLHGLGGSEKSWFTADQAMGLGSYFTSNGFRPTVVTFSFGPQWLLTEAAASAHLLTLTSEKLIPALEKIVFPQTAPTKRFILGMSMGGVNSIELTLQNRSAFSRAAFLCPAITTIGPYSSTNDIANYTRRTGADARFVAFMLDWGRHEFANNDEWNAYTPLNKILQASPIQGQKLYISCGLADNFGFQEGSAEFYRLANMRGLAIQWVPIPGGQHCSVDRASLLQFFLH
jgi:S-formylglutathione hydrolase FrmB